MTADKEPALRQVLSSVAERMIADFKASGVAKHAASKGTVREAQLLVNYLRKYLPRNVTAVHSGEVIATNGEVSTQCDILILDRSTPPLWDEEDYRIVPVECVYGVIEVKSSLDSEELRSASRKIAALKAMPKTAYHLPDALGRTRTVYGKTWPYVPLIGMVFAYDGLDIETLGFVFEELALEYQPEHSLDSIWILGKGFINWTNPTSGRMDTCPEPGSGFVAFESTPGQMLMPLTAHLHNHFATAWMPNFNIVDYMQETPWGMSRRVWRPGQTTPEAAP